MQDDYNEHGSGDRDGLGCFRGVLFALVIQVGVLAVGGLIWYLSSSWGIYG